MDTQGPGALAWRAGPLLFLLAAAPAERMQCSVDHAPSVACRMTDVVAVDGRHHLTFDLGKRQVTILAKSQTGWWSGTLDGRAAMGYERNRGNVVFSTRDLSTTFAWWYPGQAHGTY